MYMYICRTDEEGNTRITCKNKNTKFRPRGILFSI